MCPFIYFHGSDLCGFLEVMVLVTFFWHTPRNAKKDYVKLERITIKTRLTLEHYVTLTQENFITAVLFKSWSEKIDYPNN